MSTVYRVGPSRRGVAAILPVGAAVRPLPPNGRRHMEVGGNGAWVATGSKAWEFPRLKAVPVMVLPPGEDPERYRWPVTASDVVVIQHGHADRADVERLVLELLRFGARLVLAVTPAGPFFAYPEAQHDAA